MTGTQRDRSCLRCGTRLDGDAIAAGKRKCSACRQRRSCPHCRTSLIAGRCLTCEAYGPLRLFDNRTECHVPHPLLEERITHYASRAAAGLPLFGQ